MAVSLDGAGTWRNDIDGPGRLVKSGSGSLTLIGANSYRGGTTPTAGTLVAASPCALGTGSLLVAGGTLRAASAVRVRGSYKHSAGTLSVQAGSAVKVSGGLTIGRDTTLEVAGPVVISARRVSGRFARVVVKPGCRAHVTYTRTTVAVTIRPA
ncbi:autotransporter-associated beta strand repeat-containing protein [Paractinoplanes atraurantiacus]|uniref:Autotransporter-associated beta strand repeat-containing protein n=1 Tax=Paractinoplanes atraurantiacus TaxID=1036182 RepID=A0A285J2N0_9ACTN|nr:autotransporter-associated beta strand repeat-containing protein [Actinoplanes atraurantiacus]SNY54468.1 autotransporter-associated beta strand repeat-containing protein [Actinoplanes atraurantiacus]